MHSMANDEQFHEVKNDENDMKKTVHKMIPRIVEAVKEGVITTFVYFITVLEATGIKFAPTHLPLERRLQTLAALGWILLMMFGEISALILTVYLLRTRFYWLVVCYILVIANQRYKSGLGLKTWKWVRQWSWWKYLHDYFPTTLVKTVNLDPSQNYLFCIFPHGVLSTGCFSCFATDAAGFEDIFPGMKAFMLTLDGHFLVPFFRELAQWLGICSASAEAINYLLNKKNGTGNCAILVVGGAAESLNCHPGSYKVVVKKRKGFVKMAMKNGSPLVPVFSFGETELYEQLNNPEGSVVRCVQEWIRQRTGIAPVIPMGRGILQYSFGIVPQRRPVTTVVGKPMPVAKNMDPTDEEIEAVHLEFTERLQEMFEEGKSKYIPQYPNAKLIID